MTIRVGFTTAGTVEAFGDEAVTTRFFFLGILYVPVSSQYRCERGVLDIPLHGASAGIGALRIYSLIVGGIALALAGMGLFADVGMGGVVRPSLAALVVAAFAGWWSFSCAGAPTPESLRRRELLRSVAGHGALPQWLDGEVVSRTRRALLADWDARRRAWGEPADWRASVKDGPRSAEAAALLAAIAAYDAAHSGSTALADRAWQHAFAPRSGERRAAGRVSVRCPDCATVTSIAVRHAGKALPCDCGATLRVPRARVAA
jgi:hypothetical protein